MRIQKVQDASVQAGGDVPGGIESCCSTIVSFGKQAIMHPSLPVRSELNVAPCLLHSPGEPWCDLPAAGFRPVESLDASRAKPSGASSNAENTTRTSCEQH